MTALQSNDNQKLNFPKLPQRGRRNVNPYLLPNALRLVRLYRGLTVPQLAHASHIHPSSIKRWEFHTKGIRLEKLRALARYLDVPLFLLYMTPYEAQEFLTKGDNNHGHTPSSSLETHP